MNSSKRPERVLLTGGSGYLGKHLVNRLARDFKLRVLDVLPVDGADDFIQGSVADTPQVERAMEGMDALVIAHMAPNRDDTYASADLPFDINLRGTAALLQAAAKRGIRRVVLISSTAVVEGWIKKGAFLTADLDADPQTSFYSLTKHLQELTARFFHRKHGMEFVVLRPAYVITEDPLEDKYGRTPPSVNWQFIDPRDIAEAAALGLVADNIGFDIFYTLAGPGSVEQADMEPIRKKLGWKPRHTFSAFPVDA